MKKKILFFSLLWFALLLPISNASTAGLSIGSPCSSNGECASNQCENSAKTDPQDKKLAFCVCGEFDTSIINPAGSPNCKEAYGGSEDDWTCKDGANLTWDLNYCLNKDYSKTKLPIPAKETGASMETLVDMLLDPTAVTAQMYKEIDNIVAKPQTKISIPGLKFSEPKTIEEDSGKYLYIPFIGDYISSLYKYLIIVASIIATAMIIKNGFDWIISGGEAAKITQAKTRIGQSLMGLFIAVSSYFILYMINPNLVEFKNLRVRFVENIPLNLEVTSDYDQEGGQSYAPPPAGTGDLVYIPDMPGLEIKCGKQYRYCSEQCVNGLKAAAEKMHAQGYTIKLISCFRPVEQQIKLKGNPLGCQCKSYNPVDCSNCPHVGGYAFDALCKEENRTWTQMTNSGKACKGNPACKQPGTMTRNDYNCQNILIKSMRDSGMCKLYFEDWHFQPVGTSKKSCFQ